MKVTSGSNAELNANKKIENQPTTNKFDSPTIDGVTPNAVSEKSDFASVLAKVTRSHRESQDQHAERSSSWRHRGHARPNHATKTNLKSTPPTRRLPTRRWCAKRFQATPSVRMLLPFCIALMSTALSPPVRCKLQPTDVKRSRWSCHIQCWRACG